MAVPVLKTGLWILYNSISGSLPASIPSGSKAFVVLSSKATTVHPLDPSRENVALNLYETSYADQIWNGIYELRVY